MVKKNISNDERRRYIRIPNSDIVSYKKFDAMEFGASLNQGMRAYLKNISAGGVLFESEKQYPIGTLLKLEIHLKGWEKFKSEFHKIDTITKNEPLIALVHVVRIDIIQPDKKYDIGVCFSAIDDGHRWALLKYVKQTK